jgi:hypothetical protein
MSDMRIVIDCWTAYKKINTPVMNGQELLLLAAHVAIDQHKAGVWESNPILAICSRALSRSVTPAGAAYPYSQSHKYLLIAAKGKRT